MIWVILNSNQLKIPKKEIRIDRIAVYKSHAELLASDAVYDGNQWQVLCKASYQGKSKRKIGTGSEDKISVHLLNNKRFVGY